MGILVRTNKIRFSYAHVFEPYAFNETMKPKYSVMCLLPKSDTATKKMIDEAIASCIAQAKVEKWNNVVPPIVPNPIHDGDGTKQDGTPYSEECKGHWVFTISSKDRPGVVDAQKQPIYEDDFYSGCFGRAAFSVYPYLFNGKKGIGFELKHVMKLEDGERLGGKEITVDEAFD